MGVNLGKSDSESGFDESSSQMSRSGIEDSTLMLSMVRSPSSDNLSEDVIRAEVKTVAADWNSLRHVLTCSCATPFDYYVKKVRNTASIMDMFTSAVYASIVLFPQMTVCC